MDLQTVYILIKINENDYTGVVINIKNDGAK